MSDWRSYALRHPKARPRKRRWRTTGAEDKGDKEAAQPSYACGGEGAGWRWVNWVRDSLRDGTVVVNADGGWLHNIAGEAYVVVPDGFEAFAAVEEVESKTVKNRVARLGRHRERRAPAGAANTLRAEVHQRRPRGRHGLSRRTDLGRRHAARGSHFAGSAAEITRLVLALRCCTS